MYSVRMYTTKSSKWDKNLIKGSVVWNKLLVGRGGGGVSMEVLKSLICHKPWSVTGSDQGKSSPRERSTRTELSRPDNGIFNMQMYLPFPGHDVDTEEEKAMLRTIKMTTLRLNRRLTLIWLTMILIPPALRMQWVAFYYFSHPNLFLWKC